MSTSLAEQLKKLKAPQTSLLLQDKKRASLLFDPKEAANFDRQTIFELGLAGLEELKTLNARFSEYATTLFDYSSQAFERGIQTKDVNKRLDTNIKKFFFLLSPYFMLKPAHKALEWLINRFHIHQYNVDDLMMLALPYHESKIFVRVLQLINLSDESNKWHWLKPLQKPGIPLSKSALFNHISVSPYFLKLLSDTVIGAVKEHKQYAGVLTSLLAFYCTTLLGMLDHSKKGASEFHMTHLMDILSHGLRSHVVDFAAASYMVVGRLVTTANLSNSVIHHFVNCISKKQHPELKTEKALLLVLMYQRQGIKDVPFRAMTHLVSQTELPSSLGILAAKGVNTVPFVVALIKEALQIIQTQIVGDTSDMCKLVESILREVHFTTSGARKVIMTLIESFDVSSLEQGKDKSLVAVGEWNTPKEVMSWYAKPLQQLERSYPSVFDEAVCEAIKKTSITPYQAKAVKKMLGFELQIDLFDKLHHSKSKVRAAALICLAKDCDNLKEKDELALRETLLQTLASDTAAVVAAVFAFPTDVLCRILGRQNICKALTRILTNHFYKPGTVNKWTSVIPTIMSTLTSLEKGSHFEDFEILLAILPYLTVDSGFSKKVLSSEFASNNQFLKTVRKGISKFDQSSFHLALCSCFHNFDGNQEQFEMLLQLGKELLVKDTKSEGFHQSIFFYLLLLGSCIPKNACPELSLQAIHLACNLLKTHQTSICSEMCELSPTTLEACYEETFTGKIPLESFLFVINNIIKKAALSPPASWIDLQNPSAVVKLLIELYSVILHGCTTESMSSQSAYISTLNSFFKTYFKTPKSQFEFIANMWTLHFVNNSDEIRREELLHVQLRSLRLVSILLPKQKSLKWVVAPSAQSIFLPALLLALACPATAIRKVALDIVKIIALKCKGTEPFQVMLEELHASAKEIELDEEQLHLVMYTFLSPELEVQSLHSKEASEASSIVRNTLLDCILCENTPMYVKAALLSILSSVNDTAILEKLLPQGIPLLSTGNDALDWHTSLILQNLLYRINSQTVGIFKKNCLWVFVEKALSNHRTNVFLRENKFSCPAVLVCEQITRELWEAIPGPPMDYHQRLLWLLISTGTETESPSVVSAISHCIKQLSLDAKLLVKELVKMRDANISSASGQQRRRSTTAAPSPLILDTKEWRCGLTLLELLQNKKKLQSVHILLPVLFELLKKCLKFEQQAPVEYTKQLLLSFILHCCQKISPEGNPVPSSILASDVLNVEAVVHCIRGTQNPQTHHHALLLLSHMAAMVPEQVLFNIMAIFTFMGTLVLRQDDAYSFQIISKIVDTIIPILIKASHQGTLPANRGSQLEATVASVMRVFVDALLDVPEHRRLSLFRKLLSTLDPKQYLWLFLCLVIESHTVHHSENSTETKRSRSTGTDIEAPKRLEVALQIATQFSPDIVLRNCVCLVQYLRSLPVDKVLDEKQKRLKVNLGISENMEKYRVKTLFNVENHTPKQLRHYKYSIVTFLSTLLSSVPFVNQIASLDETGTLDLEPIYRELIEDLLAFIQVSLRQYDIFIDTPSSKYWRVMVAQLYDILDKVNALLPSHLFLTVVGGLMKHNLPSLRRKAMELLNSRLSSSQREAFIESCESKDLLSLLQPLFQVVSSISDEQMEHDGVEKTNDELLLNQQTALLTIKYLSKQIAFENHTKFKPLLDHLSDLICRRCVSNSNLLASVVLCAAELCSALRAHAISALPALMPALIELLAKQTPVTTDVVQISLVAATFRVVESLAAFLSPHLHRLLCALCTLSASFATAEEEQGRIAHVVAKLKGTRQKLSSAIPLRVLLPAVDKAYEELVSNGAFTAVGPLMNVLADSFTALSSSDISAMHTTLTDFFLKALELRSTYSGDIKKIPTDQINEIENHVVKALVALVLKMSETSFRPLYYRLFEWAIRHVEKKERTITFYRLSCGIAECLKGLFVLFAGNFLKNAAELLDHCNITKIGIEETSEPAGLEQVKKHEELFFGSGEGSEKKCAALVTHILKTLYNVFLYDSQNFLSRERFEALMQPVVDQLENTICGVDELRVRANDVLIPCISQMAAACTDDTLWKQMNYQLLIKTRHQVPTVRLIALEAVSNMATKLGESFLPMLPETVPFLAELLEDEEEEIETACRRVVQDLEQVLGEPIQKYF